MVCLFDFTENLGAPFHSFLEIISSNTSTTDQIAEATVTHVLLAFHMLFINILLLSLLVAMFK